jgi:hypothetical protein
MCTVNGSLIHSSVIAYGSTWLDKSGPSKALLRGNS